ncbi:hypothetical protein [Arthrobacter sp. NicSoilB8]|uniref:hypothetical protein n=1 Tax=Arthrobacter sp. NicSoilB8 TaxID=2830998 RepID=UPI001CC34B96|nr:hypothetical protein [Arthrobacter sp. NicSoilB8]BCW72434.1 hypothetical protein NicSoilB8_34780 [Arthrobacter sp. NicSoilB8]
MSDQGTSDPARTGNREGAPSQQSSDRFWPWNDKIAILLVPILLLALFSGLAIMRALTGMPSAQNEGSVLLALAVFSILPLILLITQRLAAEGGSVELASLRLSFASASQDAATSMRTTTLTENLGVAEGDAMAQTSLRSVLRALRTAHESEVTVVDLRRGSTWWETRLFILIAGAARRDRPLALAFIGESNGRDHVFLGWAAPSQLLDMHLAASPGLKEAYARALASTMQWQIGEPIGRLQGQVPQVVLPWDKTVFSLPYLADDVPDPAFAMELFLQEELNKQALANPAEPVYVNIQRLRELYEPVLVTDFVDLHADDGDWARVLASSSRRFFALTAGGKFVALLARDSLMSALVARIVLSRNDAEKQGHVRPKKARVNPSRK